MADLSKDEVKSLGRAAGLDIAEPLLTALFPLAGGSIGTGLYESGGIFC